MKRRHFEKGELLLTLREKAVTIPWLVRRCAACGAVLGTEKILCSECYERYREERLWECGTCGRQLSECTCVPPYLETASVHKLLKLLRYRVDMPSSVDNSIVYRLKNVPLWRVHQFFAEELVGLLERLSPDDSYVLTHVPRTVKQRWLYGFDQSECLARALSVRSGVPFFSLLVRKRTGTVQKGLSGLALRAANVKGAFCPADTEFSLRGKRVLLVDDIVTTGASMAECARVLRRMGAREVIGVALTVSYRHPNIKYEHEANTHEERFYPKR